MFRCLLTFIISILFQIPSFGQKPNYKQLLDSSTKYAGLFVAIQPVSNFRLSLSDTTYYRQYLEEVSHYKLDKKILSELIVNSKNLDTTYWSDNELQKSVLVKSRDEDVRLEKVLEKFKITDKKQIKLYRKQVNEYNNASAWDKNIFYFSRPIFDNTNQYAIVQFSNGHSGLSGGGSITLFHFDGDTWKEIGDIEHQRY